MLVLFDIDGTLLSGATDAHRDAMRAALRQVHGVDTESIGRSRLRAGRTDPQIARTLLLEMGASARRIDERADAVREACCRMYAQMCPQDLSRTVVPGIPELLRWLSEQPQMLPSLLTGNYEAIARLKLTRAGIGKYFPAGQGAFGSDAEDRAALPVIARRRAGVKGRPYPREDTVLVGDTPRDIACARADELRCIAVTTGPFGRDELRAADVVVDDARELRDALEALRSVG